MRPADRLQQETLHLETEMEAEANALLTTQCVEGYQRWLTQIYGFVSPLERCLIDTPELATYLDLRRLRKHLLIEQDLQTLGLRPLEVQSIPQCMWIPWFDNPFTALGWAYIIERSTLAHPNLFRQLAATLPGEAAFAATYLQVYAGTTAGMWQRFVGGLELASSSGPQLDLLVEGAIAGYRHLRRWRNTLDGTHVSAPHEAIADAAAPSLDLPRPAPRAASGGS